MQFSIFSLIFTTLLGLAAADDVIVTVGTNTSDASLVFQPQSVVAGPGDVVIFTFVQGNHSAIQSTFPNPCIAIHDTNATINGFNSGFRDTVGGTAVTTLTVSIADANTPIWFFDYATCAKGGVGVINVNRTSTETLEGFARNAIRLNGTQTNQTNGHSSNPTSSGTADGNSSESTAGGSESGSSGIRGGAVHGLAAGGSILFAALAFL